MSSPPLCPNCGVRQRRADARFCQNCGYTLTPTPAGVGSASATVRARNKTLLWIGGALLLVLVLAGIFLLGPGRKLLPCCQPPQKRPVVIAAHTPFQTSEPTEIAEPASPTTPPPPTATPLSTNTPVSHPTVALAPSSTAPSTPTPRKTPSPTPTATATNVPASIPEVMIIEQRLVYQDGELIIHKDIHFRDSDGDAYLVTYQVIQSDIQHYYVEDDAITASPDLQKRGAIVTATWRCGGKSYRITLRALILDRFGHQSEPFDLIFDCRP